MKMLSAVLGLGFLGAALQTGCGGGAPSPRDLCEHFCECGPCTSEEKSSCVESLERAEDAAKKAGCESQYDDLASCIDSLSCGALQKIATDPESVCPDEQEEVEKCGTGVEG